MVVIMRNFISIVSQKRTKACPPLMNLSDDSRSVTRQKVCYTATCLSHGSTSVTWQQVCSSAVGLRKKVFHVRSSSPLSKLLLNKVSPVCAHILYVFVCFSGLSENSGINVSPIPREQKIFLLTTSSAPFCGESSYLLK